MTVSAMLAEIPELGTLSRREISALIGKVLSTGTQDYAWPATILAALA
jgi:hypothetical protein